MPEQTERRGSAAVSWLASPKHLYEDRYRLLSRDIPLVAKSGRGELFAVCDGISSAPLGRSAAQTVADALLAFYRDPTTYPATTEGLERILLQANQSIFDWGYIGGTNYTKGGCVGTVAWLQEDHLTLLHAGDTVGMLLRPGEEPRLLTALHETGGAIGRYFGMGESLQLQIDEVSVEEGDVVLLMSDGVTKAFSPAEAAVFVWEIFERCGDLGQAAEALVNRSMKRGSTDDITVLLTEVEE